MKIEKGKLYYNHQLERVIKAQTDYEDKSGLHSDKIAVHCQTKEDWDYVLTIIGNPRLLNKSNYNRWREDSYICLKESTYGNLKEHEALGYHTITIEQFKQFYSMKAQTEPQYFAISKEEWQEYQELKTKVDKPIEILGCIMNNLDDFNTEQEFKPERYDNYQLVTSDYRFDVFKANLLGFTDDILFFGHWNSGKVK